MEQETLKKLRVLIPVDDLTPIQAQIDLALPPNRGLPNAMLEIDTNKLNQLNIQPILGPRRVQNTTTAPGGGVEVIFDQLISPDALRRVQ